MYKKITTAEPILQGIKKPFRHRRNGLYNISFVFYQILVLNSGALYILSPGFTSNAL